MPVVPSQQPPKQRSPKKLGNLKVIVALAAGTAAFLGLLYWPAEREIAQFRSELELQRLRMTEALLLPAHLERTREESQRTDRYLQGWRESYGQETASLFAEISRAITREGAQTTQFNPEVPRSHAYLREIAVRISCRGSLGQILAALQSVEALPASLWLEEFRLAPDRSDKAKLVCEMKLGIFAEKSGYSD